MIKYKCEECGSSLSIKNELAGTAGKCPKCKTKFRVPEPQGDGPDQEPSKKKKRKQVAAESGGEQKEVSEDDMIFGEGFFNAEDAPQRPRPTLPTFEEQTEDEKPKSKPKKPFGAAKPAGDNSANIASELLSKTGKKSRPSDFQEEEESEGGYDFSAINYLILWRVLPVVLGLGLLVPLFYWFFSGMLGMGPELPPLAELHGVIKIDGTPAANAQVQFIPALNQSDANSGGPSHANTGADGSYKAYYKRDVPGVIFGKHTVRVTVGPLRVQQEITVAEGETEKNIEITSQ